MARVKPFLLAKMTWPEAKTLLAETDIAIIPVGSTEQHGPALPLDTDAFEADQFAQAVAERLWPRVKTVVTPLVSYGVSPHHMPFAGTVTLRAETLIDLVVDIGLSLSNHGVKRIVVMNSHGGNSPALSIALRRLHEAGLWCVQIAWWEIVSDLVKQTFTPPYFHADDMETSVAWGLGQRVLQDKRVDEPGREPVPGYTKATMFAEAPNFSPVFDMTEYTDSGTIGNARRADPQKGKRVAEAAIERMAAFIEKAAALDLAKR
jgi:creatinine amidohydrolase